MDEEILNILHMKATGYSRDEVQEEYAVSAEGEMTLVKRKVTGKYYPPDSAAPKRRRRRCRTRSSPRSGRGCSANSPVRREQAARKGERDE